MRKLTRTTADTFAMQLEFHSGYSFRELQQMEREQAIEVVLETSKLIQTWLKDHFVNVTRLEVAFYLFALRNYGEVK